MKGKASRPSHKAKNTFVFRGFGEKVRALRVSARKFLLQRPQNCDGEDITFFYETIGKCREQNLTEQFTAFLRDLGSQVQTTTQLVHHEEHVAKCLSTHIGIPESLALQPLLDLLVAFANDIPQEFYKRHFYNFLPKLLAHLSTKDPEQIESVFLCIVSLFVVLQKYLREDLYELYHVHNFASLLSKSYPWYINELAAQSLGVLVRKLPKKDNFIGMALRKLKKDESQTQGLGRVFAAMMKSDVVQRLHSCTPKILGILLDVLGGDDEVPPEPALKTVTYAVSIVARYVTAPHPDKSTMWQTVWKEDASLVWPTLWGRVKGLLSQESVSAHHHLNAVLQVIQVVVSHKRGALIIDLDQALANCLAVIETPLSDDVGITITDILVTLLTMPNHTLTQNTLRKSVSSFLSSPFSHVVKFQFMKAVVEFPRFDNEILPLLLPFLESLVGSSKDLALCKDVVEFIAAITVQKQPPCTTGMDLSTWKAYPINFTLIASKMNKSKESHIASFLESRIKEGLSEDLSNLEDLSVYLLCLPHVLPLNHQDLAPYLTWILNDAITLLKDEAKKIVDDDKPIVHKKRKSEVVTPDINIDMNIKSSIPLNTRRVLFLIGLIIEVMSHIFTNEDFLASLGQLELLELMKRKQHYRENIHILRAVDLHFTVASIENDKDIINGEFLKEIYTLLAPSMSCANPQVRLLVVHIFSLFPVTLPPQPENVTSVENVFQILLKAECAPISPFEFRDRLRYITMVDAEHVKQHRPVCGTYDLAPLLFFLGQLYTNYRDLWNPMLSAISGYAHSLPLDVFWPLWFSKLKIASHVTQEVLLKKRTDPEEDLDLSCSILIDIHKQLAIHPGYAMLPSKPDHLNYRDLLWRAMEKFPDVCEAKNRDLVPLFFDFLEKEFFPVDFTVAPTQDVSRSVDGQSDEMDVGEVPEVPVEQGKEDQSIQEEKEEEEEEDEDEGGAASYPRRASVKSLCEQLTVFSRFHNPKMLNQTKKLEKMYQELLTHPSPTLQKLSFDCLLTYNHPYLTPYKDNVCKILEDKSFKNALALFSIDGSEQILEDGHRKDFMPYLMRILYGKMHFKTGSNSSGKSKSNLRKAVVLRFLAGASEDEFQTFLELAFDVLLNHINGTALEVIERSKSSLDLKSVVPLKRLQGALTTMENVVEKIANRMTINKSFILKIILYITNLSSLILERRSEVKKYYVSFLKHIRQQGQRQIVSFFSLLDDYCWQPEEIDAIFETMVWPNLKRLPDEGLSSRTPLLSLFECWADNPRYFPLLAKVHKEDSTLTPLTYVVKLAASGKCHQCVTGIIFNMVEKLLTLKDHDEAVPDEEGKTLPLVVCPPVVEVKRLNARDGLTQQNYGSALLVPHLEGLLLSMKILITNLSKGITVTERDLTILTSLTEWVTTKGISEDLVGLIIPLIVNKHVKNDQIIAQLLTTCSYLLPIIDDSKQFMRPLITQFGCLAGRASRIALCQAVEAIASVNPQYKDVSDLASDLNAWNPKMVDEIDFERRLDGYNRMIKCCKSKESICMDFSNLLVYNNMFVICHVEDISLRDMSRLCIDQMIDMCIRLHPTHPSEFKQVIIDRLLSQVKNGLRNEKEDVRHDIFFVLQKVVHKCHTLHEKLEDLYKLADEVDDEVDFFSNMMHIQRHRRSRALMRLADKLKNGELVLTTDTITDYLMPIVRVHLFNDLYNKDDFLVQSSVRCIGAFAQLLPWHSYLRMLKAYMAVLAKGDLKYHKLEVKVIEVVINGFHEEVEEFKVYEEKESKVRKQVVVNKESKKALPKENSEELMVVNKESKKALPKENSEELMVVNKESKKALPKENSEELMVVNKESKKALPKENSEELMVVNKESKKALPKENSEELMVVNKESKKALPKENGEELMEVEKGDEVEQADLPLSTSEEKLSKGQKVYLALVNNIIPQLKKTLAARTKGDLKHKVNKSKYPEDEDIKRIPLAFALIKLMKKLPQKVLDANVNNVLMKMISFLKCQSQPIRDEARSMLVKIMVELGGKYLPWLVSDLRSILTRGFQTHVLVFTLHSILSQMRPLLSGPNIDACLTDMIEICKNDILGIQAEEKKVMKITTKVREAHYDKSYAILNFTAEFISVASLADIILPLKEVLGATQDKKIVNKMVRCLNEIATGLERNENIVLMQKSVFVYGLLNEKLTLLTTDKRESFNKRKTEEKIKRPDAFLLAPEPKKARLIPKTSVHTTSHVFIEFGLKLLCSLIRKERFNPKEPEHVKLLDPYLGVMQKCINSEYPDISQYALKCINLLVKYPLPSISTQLKDICSEMFVILHKFSSSELAKGKIYELVQLTFRSLAFIIKTVESYHFSVEQIRVLLQYVQECLDDSSQQATVFAVLQAIVAKKIDAPELHVLMESVKKMSITCSRQYALNQARVTYYSYLLTYPMKRKVIVNQILYYLGNVAYSTEEGRHSAMLLVNGVITNFPKRLFTKELEASMWFKLSEQIVKEQFKENRSLLHKSLMTLFERSERKTYLIELCMKLLNEDTTKNIESSAVAIQLSCKSLSAFLDGSVKKFPKNLAAVVIPKVVMLLNPSRYSTHMKGINFQEDSEEGQRDLQIQQVDNALVMLLEVFNKLVGIYMTDSEWSEHVGDDVWFNIQSLLLYPHIRVRLHTTGLVGQLLAALPVEGTAVPILCSTTDKARSLVLDLCEVLQTQAMADFASMTQLSLSIVRNLIYLIRNCRRIVLVKESDNHEIPDKGDVDGSKDEEVKEKERDPVVRGALWVLRRVGDMAYRELQESGKECTLVREALLNLMAGVIVVVGEKLQSPKLLNYIIKHLARELSDKRIPEALTARTQEVANLVKDHIGVEIYSRHFTRAQVGLSKKRWDRKAHEHQQKLVNPRLFSKKKKKKRLANSDSKKIIIAERKGKIISKSKLAKLRASAIAS